MLSFINKLIVLISSVDGCITFLPYRPAGSGFSWWWPHCWSLATPTLQWRTSPPPPLLSAPCSTTRPPRPPSCPSPHPLAPAPPLGQHCPRCRSPNLSPSASRRGRISSPACSCRSLTRTTRTWPEPPPDIRPPVVPRGALAPRL